MAADPPIGASSTSETFFEGKRSWLGILDNNMGTFSPLLLIPRPAQAVPQMDPECPVLQDPTMRPSMMEHM
jgi:hypothetical protein